MTTDLFIEDQHHLNAAKGWLELGNHVEAYVELEKIAPVNRLALEVLSVRWELYKKTKQWVAAASCTGCRTPRHG